MLLLISTTIALGCAEVLLRMVYPQQLGIWYTLSDGMVIHPPGLSTHMADFNLDIRFNSLGMRDREHVIGSPERKSVFRILILGDSFMEAQQVAFEESFPHLLETRLRALLHREVEVVNCSVSGWGQDDELAYLERYAQNLKPDLILVAMTLHNDVTDNMREQYYVLKDGTVASKPVARLPRLELTLLRIKGFLAAHSHVWQLLRKYNASSEVQGLAMALDSHVLQLVAKRDGPGIEKGWRLTGGLIERIQHVGQSFDAETVVMLIPLKMQLHAEVLDAFLVRHGKTADQIILDLPQKKMTEYAVKSHLSIIDLLPDFLASTQVSHASLYLEEGHWNVYGHKLAAEIAAKALLERGLVISAQMP